jgi:hypothetical protein
LFFINRKKPSGFSFRRFEMSKNFRNAPSRNGSDQNNGPVRADPRAVNSRQRESIHRQAPTWSWITERSAAEAACLDILRGKTGTYPIFGIQLYVEDRPAGDQSFAALVYHDAKLGGDGQNLCGNLRSGFWVGVKSLLVDLKRGFKNENEELFILTLLAQPEMQTAIGLYKKEEQEARVRAATMKKNLLASLRSKVIDGKHPATTRVETAANPDEEAGLGSITGILTATHGSIEYDGLTVYITTAPEGGYAVRVKNAPDGHPMCEIASKPGIFAHQNALMYSDDAETERSEWTAAQHLGYKLRMYLRSQLMDAGMSLTPPVTTGKTTSNGNSVHTPAPEENGMGKSGRADTSLAG